MASTRAQQLALEIAEQDTKRIADLAREKQRKEDEKKAKKAALLPLPGEKPAVVATETKGHISRSQAFGVSVSASRINAVLQKVLHGKMHEQLEELKKKRSVIDKELFAPKKVAADAPPWQPPTEQRRAVLLLEKEELTKQIKELGEDEFQMSKDVDVLIATLIDTMMKSFADFVFANTKSAGRKTATLECVLGKHRPTIGYVPLRKSEYWGLLASTEVIKMYDSHAEEALAARRAAERAVAEEQRKAEIELLVQQGKDPKKEMKRKKPAPRDPNAEPSLETYMAKICANMKLSYDSVNHVSGRLTEQMAQISLEIVKNLSYSVRNLIELTGRRTATPAIVRIAIMNALHTAGVCEDTRRVVAENLDLKLNIRDERTRIRDENSDARRAEKFQQLTPAEQAEIIRQQIEDEKIKKQQAIENKRKHAEKILEKAKFIQSDDSKIQDLERKAQAVLTAPVIPVPVPQPVAQQAPQPVSIQVAQPLLPIN